MMGNRITSDQGRRFLEQLSVLIGKEPVKTFFKKVSLTRKNNPGCNIPIPTVFVFNMRKGEGFSFLAEKITNILCDTGFLKFYSKEQLVEYTFVQDVADCQPKRTPVPYSADSTRHN